MRGFSHGAATQMNALLHKNTDVEQVLCVGSWSLRDALDEEGLVGQPQLSRVVEALNAWPVFIARPEAEKTSTYRQIIPYVIFKCTETERYFVTRRTRQQTEARLHDKLSLGVGGHVNPQDHTVTGWSTIDQIAAGLERELEEEMLIVTRPETTIELVGVLNDTSTEVSSMHLGLLFYVRVPQESDVTIRETENMTGEWVAPRDIGRLRGDLESWARLVYEHIYNPLFASPIGRHD